MQLNLVGINHETAPVTVREKVAISTDKLAESLALMRLYIPHAVIVSTCNRTEIYTVDGNGAEIAARNFLQSRLKDNNLDRYLYCAQMGAAEHLFRLASGLESMILGEYEVLGQVRQSLEAAEHAGMVNLPLRYAFQSAIRTGRRVREETAISQNALSVSSVAVDLASQRVGELRGRQMMVIGAGEAGRLVARVAREKGVSRIIIASRTRKRAEAVATALSGVAIDMSDLPGELAQADILVTCAAAPHALLKADNILNIMKNRPDKPLIIMDIGIPRNIEPDVGTVHNVFLYNIDDLNGIAKQNRKLREGAIQMAEEIIRDETIKLAAWWQEFELRPVVSALMGKAEEIRCAQLNQTVKKLPPLTEEQRDSLEAMTRAIVNKILKDPVQYLKNNGNASQAKAIIELFQLDTEKHS